MLLAIASHAAAGNGSTNSAYQIPATGPVLYDNSLLYWGYFYYPSDATGEESTNEFGNEISFVPTFPGQERTIGSMQFEYYMTHGVNGGETAQFRLYDTHAATNITTIPNPPGTLLYDSGSIPIVPGFNTVLMDGLGLRGLPNTVTWTVQFAGLAGQERVGLLLYAPPSTGHSFADYWEKQDGNWVIKQFPVGADLVANFGAAINASAASVSPNIVVTPGRIRTAYGAPPVPPGFPAVVAQAGYDRNRSAVFYRLALHATPSDFGVIDLQPYANWEYRQGTEITLTARPAPGYAFQSWSGDVSTSANPVTLVMEKDRSVIAHFVMAPGALTSVRGESGQIVIEWSGGGVLQQAGAITGPWSDLPMATSPFTTPNSGPAVFFRLKGGL
jgi:hypothetical protein